MKKSLRTVAFGVVMTLPGVAAAGTVMINTDSTVAGTAASSAPPLPQASSSAPSLAASSAPPLPQTSSRAPSTVASTAAPLPQATSRASSPSQGADGQSAPQASNDLQWERVGAGEGAAPELASNTTSQVPPRDVAGDTQRTSSPSSSTSVEGGSSGQSQSVSSPSPSSQRWELEPGLLKEQLVAWGKRDPLWDVLWEGSKDFEIEVTHNFYGDLDESVVEVVKALAQAGVPIRLMRAQANHKLIVRSGK